MPQLYSDLRLSDGHGTTTHTGCQGNEASEPRDMEGKRKSRVGVVASDREATLEKEREKAFSMPREV